MYMYPHSVIISFESPQNTNKFLTSLCLCLWRSLIFSHTILIIPSVILIQLELSSCLFSSYRSYPNLFMLAPLLCIASTGANHGLHPLILVPGSGGNQLEARLTNAYRPSSFFCDPWIRSDTRNEKWYRIWFDLSVFLPPLAKCFAERLTLRFDPELDDYRNAIGVETRVPCFGSTRSLICSVPRFKYSSSSTDKYTQLIAIYVRFIDV